MASVDDRIVHMEFDNAAFERKISTTIASIDKLNSAMKMKGAQEGLHGVSDAASKFNLGKVGDAIQGIASKFTSLGVIGITILSNITNKAINAGLAMAKHLSLDNVIAGFKEYELNIGSIQTILSNTKADGTNLQQVNAALDELNHYADKTIYNFGQMTKNIGTFTAAGVDLDTSVQSIKGISNIAAISGSSAEQASNAMYQLSQAISTGSLKLMDWNSVVNAGMGGEVFQKALFETGKAMKTIKDVPMTETFEEWTSGGNSFRSSLESGWATTEVLTKTLQGFTGDLSEAQLMAMGYSKEQAAQFIELGKTGVEAATKVRTLTGLIDTTKEAIGSGWSESFKIIIGNFEEATALFSGVSQAISGMVERSSKARNELLGGWNFLGGRNILIGGLVQGFQNLLAILKPIRDAMHEVFPPATAMGLLTLTKRFAALMEQMKPSAKTLNEIKRIFMGVFSILKIGWTIIKETASLFAGLFQEFTGAGSGQTLEFLAKIGDFFNDLRTKLVLGGGIHDWFVSLHDILGVVIDKIISFGGVVAEVFTKVVDWFKGIDPKAPKALEEGLGRLEDRFSGLKSVWKGFRTAFMKVAGVLDEVWGVIKDWFSTLGEKISDAIGSPDFSTGLDAINTGLFGGIVLLIRKFLKDGISVDLTGGLADKIGGVFDELTGTLKSMQTKIKAEALMKIAEAIAVLTASVLVLSLIDSAALSKSLAAMAVGFGELMASFAALGKINSDPKSAATLGLLATDLILLSGAILVLSAAVAVLSTVDPTELATGMGSIALMLGLLIGTAKLLEGNVAGLFAAGAAMVAIAISMTILAGAIKLFGNMDMTELGVGMASVAAGLLIIAGAMRLMPKGMALQGAGLILVAVSLNILAGAVKLFSMLSWGEMAKGMVGIAGALLLIGAAMQEMPLTMPLIGAGLILVGIGLQAVAKSLSMMASLSWGEMAKGLVGITASLLILAAATEAMTGAIPGAIAIGIVAAALLLMVKVVGAFASVSWGDLLHGLGALALVLAALALAALAIQPAIPAMLALGAALVVIGAGFALFGVGVSLIGSGFVMLAKAGKAGSEALIASMKAIGAALPTLVASFAEGILELIKLVGKFAPEIAAMLGKLLGALLDEIAKLIPKIGKVVRLLIDELLKTLRFYIPQLVDAGLDIILGLLQGIRDHIGEIVTVVGEIITNFLDALGVELPKIVQSVADLFVAFFTSVAEAVGKVAGTLMVGVGISFLMGFWDGISGQLSNLWGLIKGLVTGVIDWFKSLFGIQSPSTVMKDIGISIMQGLINGIQSLVGTITTFFKQLPGKIVSWIGSVLTTLKTKGSDLIQGILTGINNKIKDVKTFFGGIAKSVVSWIGNLLSTLVNKGTDLIQGFKNGFDDKWQTVKVWFTSLGGKITSAITNPLKWLYQIGKDIIQGLIDGVGSMATAAKDAVVGVAKSGIAAVGHALGINSPSKVYFGIGQSMMEGMTLALDKDTTVENSAINVITRTVQAINDSMKGVEEFQPAITPVLDFSRLEEDSKKIAGYISTSSELAPTVSFNQARAIANTSNAQQEGAVQTTEPAGPVTFNQNIYAPEQLSTADIYKQTRNQITMAKEALSVP